MKTDKKIVWQEHRKSRKQTFLQPLAVGIACAVFIGLILIMGVMDLRRSESSLTSLIEKQGVAVINVVQRLAEENLNAIIHAHQGGEEKTTGTTTDEAFSPQTWLTGALADLAKEVDDKWKAAHLSGPELKNFASEKGLWLIAVMNRQRQVVYQSRSLPEEFSPESSSPGKAPAITITALNRLAQMKKIGYIALERKDGSGAIIIALDQEGLIYWGLKIAVQKAIEKLGEGQKQGLVYVLVMNKKGVLLDSAGDLPEGRSLDASYNQDLLAAAVKIKSRKVLQGTKNILDIAAPLYINNKIAGIVRVGIDREGTKIILAENTRNLVFFMIIVVLITLFSMWLLYRNQNRHLAGIVDMERRLEKAERLSALGQLAAGVAHEIRNPLNAISMASQRLKRDFTPIDDVDKINEFQLLSGVIRDEIRRLNGIIEEFLSFSKSRRLELHDYPAAEVLQKVANLISVEAEARGIQVTTRWDEKPLIIPMDMDKLQQALLNFVKNAMESITGEGAIALSIERKGREHIAISIADTGCGIKADEVERIFNPEYTTKEKGLGLGLPLAHEIIRGHGGEIRVFSAPGKGTTFEILLPLERLSEKTNGNAQKGKENSL